MSVGREKGAREPLDAALAVQIGRLERVSVRALRVLAAAGVAFGVAVGLTLSPGLGFACAATCGALVVWFTVLARALDRGAGRGVRAVAVVIEALIPWAFLLVIALRQGPVYALASWVPPLLFGALIVAYATRLRPRACLLLGVIGAIAHLAIYALAVHGRLPAESASHLFTRPSMQVSRAASLLLGGVLGAVVARGMRAAIARAESVVREQDLFGKYRLVRRIASGGMGIVFEARYCPEGGFERRVAVKRIHPHLAATRAFVDAFRDEAELSARLAHPNVVQVLDFGRVADSFFLAMEFVDGTTLAGLVKRCVAHDRALSPPLVGYVLRQILAALAHAHEGARGDDGKPLRIVHRDLCPQNVLVSRNGEVKLTDFGIARSLRDARASMTRNVAGHVGYMAPEQARAGAFDVRADLFPVGAIGWELFAERPLFRRDNEAASLLATLGDDVVPITSERADLDAAWDAFFARALARDPAERFPSAAAMLAALDAIPDARGGTAEDLSRLVEEVLVTSLPRAPELDELPTEVAVAHREAETLRLT